jgi:hypothetical protein
MGDGPGKKGAQDYAAPSPGRATCNSAGGFGGFLGIMALRFNPMDNALPIEVQLQAEKATALRRVGEKLETLLAELAETGRELLTLTGAARAQRVARHQWLRAEAEHQRWCLIVQREAMGLFNHADVYEQFRIPPPVT